MSNSPVLQTVAEYLDQHDLTFAWLNSGSAISLPLTANSVTWHITILHNDEIGCLTLIARNPVGLAEERRKEVAVLLAEYNCSRWIGGFQLDMSDGDLFYCVSHVLASDGIEEEVFKTLFASAYAAVEEEGVRLTRLACVGHLREIQLVDQVRRPVDLN